jgi:hypothetical protein
MLLARRLGKLPSYRAVSPVKPLPVFDAMSSGSDSARSSPFGAR